MLWDIVSAGEKRAMKAIKQIIRRVEPHWVGDGFPVRTLFTYNDSPSFDPFLLLDYAGPHVFEPSATTRGVGEHPHRGFETVTIVYQGELEHRDSSGSHGIIGPGDVQWMTAASGIVHEEFHSERFTREGGTLEMIQLWVNLPAKAKMCPPRYQGLVSEEIPCANIPGGGGTVRVIAGNFHGILGAAQTFTPMNVWDLLLSDSVREEIALPEGHTSIIVVQSGEIRVNSQLLSARDLAVFDPRGTQVAIESTSPARLIVLTGEPIGEPVVGQGPFVMNTREEISQAIQDYRAGRMGQIGLR